MDKMFFVALVTLAAGKWLLPETVGQEVVFLSFCYVVIRICLMLYARYFQKRQDAGNIDNLIGLE